MTSHTDMAHSRGPTVGLTSLAPKKPLLTPMVKVTPQQNKQHQRNEGKKKQKKKKPS